MFAFIYDWASKYINVEMLSMYKDLYNTIVLVYSSLIRTNKDPEYTFDS